MLGDRVDITQVKAWRRYKQVYKTGTTGGTFIIIPYDRESGVYFTKHGQGTLGSFLGQDYCKAYKGIASASSWYFVEIDWPNTIPRSPGEDDPWEGKSPASAPSPWNAKCPACGCQAYVSALTIECSVRTCNPILKPPS